ncbi:MAG: hypothetical protein MK194_13585 [Roseibacillus sp.]|nr:hypothetical protein [Roseibacillus sp.]
MKAVLTITLAMAALTQIGVAQLKIPRSVFKMEDLKAAKDEAIGSEKPLVFVYTDPGTT